MSKIFSLKTLVLQFVGCIHLNLIFLQIQVEDITFNTDFYINKLGVFETFGAEKTLVGLAPKFLNQHDNLIHLNSVKLDWKSPAALQKLLSTALVVTSDLKYSLSSVSQYTCVHIQSPTGICFLKDIVPPKVSRVQSVSSCVDNSKICQCTSCVLCNM